MRLRVAVSADARICGTSTRSSRCWGSSSLAYCRSRSRARFAAGSSAAAVWRLRWPSRADRLAGWCSLRPFTRCSRSLAGGRRVWLSAVSPCWSAPRWRTDSFVSVPIRAPAVSALVDGATVSEGLRSRSLLDRHPRVLLQHASPVRRGHSFASAAHRSRRLGLQRRAGVVGIRRRKPARTPHRRIAPRPVLRRVGRLQASAGRRRGRLSARERAVICEGAIAAFLIGIGTAGESDVVPYLLTRYFGLRSCSTLYGVAWIATALGAAGGPILMGRAFDTTGSYETCSSPSPSPFRLQRC